MSNRDFLLEIGLEEVPARFVPQAVEQLKSKLVQWLQEQRISYSEAVSYATPRRLAVLIKQMAEKQEDKQEEAKGPSKKIAMDAEGNWTKAAEGFARGQGAAVSELYFKEVNGVEYVYVAKETKGMETLQLLPDLSKLIQSMTFPKNMRWGTQELRFVRPIRWLVALFGEDVIPFEITGIHTGNETYGHRFLGQKVSITQPAEFERLLLAQHVVVNAEERKQAIVNQLEELEASHNWVIPRDSDLLEEVTYLVEYPTALHGEFDPEFLSIPQEVLITSMKEHQRYFPVRDTSGKLLPYFVTIRNGGIDPTGTVTKGNEKVLRARLADARFFYEEDKKLSIPKALAKLEQVVFHEELGTLGDKVKRIREIAAKLSKHIELSEEVSQKVDRTAEICKFDLVSQMVYEFPELQGRMGQEYAILAGEDQEIAQGIYEHYWPRFAGDDLPQTKTGAVVSIADKLDTIVACFSIGIIPTGSQDPYALRRQASGIVQILLKEKWNITLPELFTLALESLEERKLVQRNGQEVIKDLESFFALRIKNRLQEQGIRYDFIDAVTHDLDVELDRIFTKAELLSLEFEKDSFKALVEAFTRVNNLAQKADIEQEHVIPERFEDKVEQELYDALQNIQLEYAQAVEEQDWSTALSSLAKLQQPIEHFFDQVMVMAEDKQVRSNRLTLLQQIAKIVFEYADFSAIVFNSKG